MTRGDRMTPDPRTYKKLFDELYLLSAYPKIPKVK